MTEQNVCLVKLNNLLTKFFNLAEYNLSSGSLKLYFLPAGENLQKVKTAKSPKSHNRNRALSAGLTLSPPMLLSSPRPEFPQLLRQSPRQT